MTKRTEAEAQIEKYRRAIDNLDVCIVELLNQRAQISARIQRCRINSGGPRTVLSREMAILARYQEGLGAVGPRIAMDVLELCRGAGPAQLRALSGGAE